MPNKDHPKKSQYRTAVHLVNVEEGTKELVYLRYDQKEKRWYFGDKPVSEEDLENMRDLLNKGHALGWLNKPEDL